MKKLILIEVKVNVASVVIAISVLVTSLANAYLILTL